MERREFSGAVITQSLAAGINSSVLSFSVGDGSTFPTGSVNSFVVVIDRAHANEEKVLISSRSGNTFTISQRGYDGTIANSHTSGASVDHIFDAVSAQDMNTTTYDTQVLQWMKI
jgi:hypothetical protein